MKALPPTNIIYFGVPGTGKTYQLQKMMQNYTDNLPQQKDVLELTLTRLSWREVICLIFLDEKRLLTVTEIVEHKYAIKKAHKHTSKKSIMSTIVNVLYRFSNPCSLTITKENIQYASNSFFDKDHSSAWYLIDDVKEQLTELLHTLTQLEGLSSKENVSITRFRFVSFHQSYGYEEFIEGLKPVINSDNQLVYKVQQGVFITLCEQARKDPHNRYAIFIDEINRANVSKVFGELLTLIEVNKREGMLHALSVTLAYSGKLFSVPANIDIYATMNTADRSLTALDSAMRRRFDFIEIVPNISLLSKNVNGVDLQALLTNLNLRIEALLGVDYIIGHATFLNVDSLDALNKTIKRTVIPLLQEYCFNDLQQVRIILADDKKPFEQQIIQEKNISHLGLDVAHHIYQLNPTLEELTAQSYMCMYGL